MTLEKYVKDIYTCTRCGYCKNMVHPPTGVYRRLCPTLETLGFESDTGRGKIQIARAILEGRLNYSSKLAERIYACLLCGNCEAHCPLGVKIGDITRAMRQDLVNKNFGPPDSIKIVDDNLVKTHNVFGEEPKKAIDWTKGLDLPKKAETIYFSGCYSSYRYHENAKATIAILREGGINPGYLGLDEWCCGVTPLADGNIMLAEELIYHNVEVLKKSNAKRVVTSCAGCYHALKSDYKEVIGQLPFDIVHSSELFEELINKGKIKVNNKFESIVTYHDPCHLGRYEKIFDAPRNVLQNIPGLTLEEMLQNRENAWCCGGGTTEYVAYPDITRTTAEIRVREAQDTKADIIATTCPLCVDVLKQQARRYKMKVYNLPVLLAEVMNIRI